MKSAFSLVELSIVLVILGLLVGGVLSGQSLIRAAELRAVSSEYSRYFTATQTFRDKYFALPGDMTNATAFWGTMATGTCPNATAGTGTQTCNGDGDGQIDQPAAASQTGEAFGFWKQLANAGLIEGTYTGIAGSARFDDAQINQNVPRSRLSNAGWSAAYLGTQPILEQVYIEGQYGNLLFFGGEDSSNQYTWSPALAPEEAWNIDTKVDDGRPGLGRVRAMELYSLTFPPPCINTTVSTTVPLANVAAYALDSKTRACPLIFLID